MDKKIEAAIKETLVVTNKGSIYRTVDRIKLIVAQEQALQQAECKKLLPLFDKCLDLLRSLHDIQNGPPLVQDEQEWNSIMKETIEFLEAHEKRQ